MTILAVVRDVCAMVGVEIPTSVFSGINTNRTMQEMLAHANEMAQRTAGDTKDWTTLKTYTTFIGDGVKTAFDLPVDYRRMPTTANLWVSSYGQSPARFFPSTDEWLKRRNNDATLVGSEWTIIGGKMHIWPAMAIGTTASFVYLSKNCVALTSGGFGETFMADNDRYVLDERLLKLNMIWQWKASKGSPYAEDMGTYTDALAMATGYDSPAPIILGSLPVSANARIAYPFPVTGPDWPLT